MTATAEKPTTDAHENADAAAGEHEHHGVGHIVSPKILVTNCLALLVLTVVTVLVAKVDFAEWQVAELNIFVALAIAVVKASLVCLFFMHLRWDRPFNSFVLVLSLALVALFIGFAFTDSAEYQNILNAGDGIKVQETLTATATELAEGGGGGAGGTGAGTGGGGGEAGAGTGGGGGDAGAGH